MNNKKIPVIVKNIRQITPLVKEFTLVAVGEVKLPAFSAGSHILVIMQSDTKQFKNAYSLVSVNNDHTAYTIAVRREEQGRGGSRFLHDQMTIGSQLLISRPVNLFAIHKTARKHLIIAGGIGITPFMAYINDLQYLSADVEFHYAVRSVEYGAFVNELTERLGEQLFIYNDELNQGLDIAKLLAKQPLGTHVYVCGPGGMVSGVRDTADELGWPLESVHYEVFAGAKAGKPFKAELAKSNKEVWVKEDESLLEVLENNSIVINSSCRGGACGMCKIKVINGSVEHNDFFLTETEKTANQYIMPCVSRCKEDVLVLDI